MGAMAVCLISFFYTACSLNPEVSNEEERPNLPTLANRLYLTIISIIGHEVRRIYMSKEKIIIESNARFSESILWQLQREYFDKQGVQAWVSQVPNFVTSNTFVANCYAQLVINFYKDCLSTNPEAGDHLFYVLELGTGTGQLSFYVLQRLKELCTLMGIEKMPFCYVMTDFTESNLKFWKSNPCFKTFLENGSLDFAIFNMEEDKDIHLVMRNATLSKDDFVNPLIVFANYIFDTVAHDCFSVEKHVLREVRTNLSCDASNIQGNQIVSMEALETNFTESDIKENFYDNDDFNYLLDMYKASIKSSKILIPISGLKTIAKLRALCNDKLLVLASDKGYTSLKEIDNLYYPHFGFHGSFSMMVNFHAIGKYFKHIKGDYLFQTLRKGLKTCLFVSGSQFADLPHTSLAFNQYAQEFSPADYFIIHRYISDTYFTAQLDTLASHLVLTKYDPYMYHRLSERICQLIPDSDAATVKHLMKSAKNIANNFFFSPDAADVMFDLGQMFQMANDYATAYKYYERSIKIFGQKHDTVYNMAICLQQMGETKKAIKQFKLAKSLELKKL